MKEDIDVEDLLVTPKEREALDTLLKKATNWEEWRFLVDYWGRWCDFRKTKQKNKRQPIKMIKEIIKQIDSWQFATCPTETKEPFFWRWTKYGKEQLATYIYDYQNQRKEKL